MASEKSNLHYDKRIAQRYIARGQLDRKDWEKHLKTLPDLADKATIVDTLPPEAEDYGYLNEG